MKPSIKSAPAFAIKNARKEVLINNDPSQGCGVIVGYSKSGLFVLVCWADDEINWVEEFFDQVNNFYMFADNVADKFALYYINEIKLYVVNKKEITNLISKLEL